MKRLIVGAALVAATLPLGGCTLGMMWLAASETNKGQEPFIVEPAPVDPVRDGRVYRNDTGATLQVVNGRLLIENNCLRVRGKLRSTGRVNQNGPPVPLYRFDLTEKVALSSRCQRRVEELTGLELYSWQSTAEWNLKHPPADPQHPGWTIMITELAGSAKGGWGDLTFHDNNTVIQDAR